MHVTSQCDTIWGVSNVWRLINYENSDLMRYIWLPTATPWNNLFTTAPIFRKISVVYAKKNRYAFCNLHFSYSLYVAHKTAFQVRCAAKQRVFLPPRKGLLSTIAGKCRKVAACKEVKGVKCAAWAIVTCETATHEFEHITIKRDSSNSDNNYDRIMGGWSICKLTFLPGTSLSCVIHHLHPVTRTTQVRNNIDFSLYKLGELS